MVVKIYANLNRIKSQFFPTTCVIGYINIVAKGFDGTFVNMFMNRI